MILGNDRLDNCLGWGKISGTSLGDRAVLENNSETASVEWAAFVEAALAFSVMETANNGDLVGVLTASNNPDGKPAAFTIVSADDRDGDGTPALAIAPETGEIIAADSGELDIETAPNPERTATVEMAFVDADPDLVLNEETEIASEAERPLPTPAVAPISDETAIADASPADSPAIALNNLPEPRTFDVTSAEDSGVGSLRQAVLDANDNPGADTIRFDESLSGATIILTGGQLTIADDVEIQGLGADRLTLAGNGNSRVLLIDDKNTENLLNVAIAGLTISGGTVSETGSAGSGGGIRNLENLTLLDSQIENSSASFFGGGISHELGTLTINNSTIANNTATRGGGISNNATVRVIGSTLGGNSATRDGGGIWSNIGDDGEAGSLALISSTINDNAISSGTGGGGIRNVRGSLVLANSIIANSDRSDDLRTTQQVTLDGVNIVADGSIDGPLAVDPLLSPLQDNGGPTLTYVPLAQSPAIDAGNLSFIPVDNFDRDRDGDTQEPIPFDQRGATFPRLENGALDLGATEAPTFFPPEFSATSFQFAIAETASNGAIVGTVTASDPNGEVLSFAIVSQSDRDEDGVNTFAIDEAGQITVTDSDELNFETQPDFSIIVEVSDGFLTATAPVEIALNDINEPPNIENFAATIFEDTPVGTAIGTMVASDPDANTALSFSIISGTLDRDGDNIPAFAIAPETGIITVSDRDDLDFETVPNLNFTVEVSDGQLSDTATVAISLSDVNETPSVSSTEFRVAENSAIGTPVGTVAASDPESEELTFAISAGDLDPDGDGTPAFEIDPNTGAITVRDRGDLDFETTASFAFEIEISDGESTETIAVTVALNDVNEVPALADLNLAIDENLARDTVVATAIAADPEGSPLNFAIAAGNPDRDEDGTPAFAISPGTGELTVADSDELDFETAPDFTLTVQVSDGELSDTATFAIALNNLDEPPVPNSETFAFSLDENSSVSTLVGAIAAADPEGDALTFRIETGNLDLDGDGIPAFAIAPGTGEITVADRDELDFETEPDFTLTVEVGASSIVTVAIALNDLPEPLEFLVTNTNDSGAGSLRQAVLDANRNLGADTIRFDESLSGATIVLNGGQLVVTEDVEIQGLGADRLALSGNENSRVLLIDDGNPDSLLDVAIAGVTIANGSVSEAGPAGNGGGIRNLENLTLLDSQIESNSASFFGGGISHESGTLTISNSTIANNTATRGAGISNNATAIAIGSTLGGNSATRDGGGIWSNIDDSEAGSLTLIGSTINDNAISSGTGGGGIRNVRGSLVLANSIVANSGRSDDLRTTQQVTLDGVNIVADGSIDGPLAVDPLLSPLQDNGGPTLTYVLLPQSPAIDVGNSTFLAPDRFDLDSDGNTQEPIPFDQRGEMFPRLNNDALDLGATEAPTFFPPEFEFATPTISSFQFAIDETASNGEIVGTVTASDRDDEQLFFAILSENDRDGDGINAFAIDDLAGQITVADRDDLDFETQPNVLLSVEVSDGFLTDTAPVEIVLNDINEPPSIEDLTLTIAEELPVGTEIGTLAVGDPDANTTLAFSIVAENLDPDEDGILAFAIAPGTGVITVSDSGDLDFEAVPELGFTVEVSDGEFTNTATVEISLSDVDEAPSVSSAEFRVDENSAIGTPVATVAASDPENETLTFAIFAGDLDPDGDGTPAFEIDPNTGAITVGDRDDLDFETTTNFAFDLEISDGELTDTITATIALNDINEAPVFTSESAEFTSNVAAPPGSFIGSVAATDPDTSDRLTYTITAGNDPDGNGTPAFAIAPETGEIAVANSAELADSDPFELEVTAIDIGENEATTSVTVDIVSLDIDGSGTATAFNDGLIIFRYLSGLTPSTFTDAFDANASRSLGQVVAVLEQLEAQGLLDADGSGATTAFNDGVVIFRHLAGLASSTFNNALDPNATRTPDAIAAFLDDLIPLA